MEFSPEPLTLIATSTFGLEAVVKRELLDLGYEGRILRPGRITFTGGVDAIFRANTWLRTADRVLLELGKFEAKDFGELFDQTYALPWEQWIGPDAKFPVTGRSVRSQLSSVPACQKIVKKAIVKKLQAAHKTETLPETGAQYTVEVALLNDEALLTIDTTGPGLNKRGYRKLMGPAPLKETLAAALIQLSFWQPDRQLIDPFCGSGTIPIEAAMIARNIAPGLYRRFAADDWNWKHLPNSPAKTVRQEARDAIKPNIELRIIGTDIDEQVLSLARYHAKIANVENDVHFQQLDFANLTNSHEYGCIICNPPYGERIGSHEDVREIYENIPGVLKRFPTWSHFILTAWEDFERLVGQEADRRRKLYNGRIECAYYQFHGPRPPKKFDAPTAAVIEPAAEKPPAMPAFGGLKQNAQQQAEMFANRLLKNARHLRKFPTKQGITCYRIYDRDIPEVPMLVDIYEGGRLYIAEYDRPHDRTSAQHTDWLDMIAKTAAETMGIAPENVFMKRRQRQRGADQYEKFADSNNFFTVGEGGLKFKVNLADYLDTGLFLDHRVTRGIVREAVVGRRVLNIFAYTGSFSVYAADGGARSITTVDMSNTYLEWARENMAANGFDDPKKYKFIRDDAMGFLKFHEPGIHYDLAVVDPPTYSNSKKTEKDFDIQRDHVELLNNLMKLMLTDAPIFFSTNFRKFKFAESKIGPAEIREISKQTIPVDFRNKRIHRCWKIVKK
ncbi:MAG: bifunctional 23S rRNA (guanine(2069)-N(7))-methyltransferase RlmK/23S rRNA (guanine(2445)-N(2))-methyltransferase RlmL [Phycisphaerae bacterium]|nr:bifunctional 23S rRNA (guanine(2069)-N(7))-methyltransferase RlmK/23S rRNA (guanine(2445)-N(2))-methyltransferase RlmL [Phycisphaerae bacterium]